MGLILCRAIGVGCLKRYRFSPLEDMLLSPLPIAPVHRRPAFLARARPDDCIISYAVGVTTQTTGPPWQ